MFGLLKKNKKQQPVQVSNTLAGISNLEFSRYCRLAQILNVQIVDMGMGYSLTHKGKRVGFLPLTLDVEEIPIWIEWAAGAHDFVAD